MCRAVHRLGGLSLCPTRNQLVRDRVGRCPTHEKPKTIGKRQKSARSCLIRPRSGEIQLDLVEISLNLMIFPPNRAENHWIWFIYTGSDCFGRQNLPNQDEKLVGKLKNRKYLMSSGRLSFMGFEGWDSKLTLQRWVLELGTCFRPPDQSNRVVVDRVLAKFLKEDYNDNKQVGH